MPDGLCWECFGRGSNRRLEIDWAASIAIGTPKRKWIRKTCATCGGRGTLDKQD